jgi:hypothetical protein
MKNNWVVMTLNAALNLRTSTAAGSMNPERL